MQAVPQGQQGPDPKGELEERHVVKHGWVCRGLASCAGLLLLAQAAVGESGGRLEPDDLRSLGIDMGAMSWNGAAAPVGSSASVSVELQARRGHERTRDVVAVLATVRTFEDDHSGERRRRILRVYRVSDGRAELVNDLALGDPNTYVWIEDVADLDGDTDAEVLLGHGGGGSAGLVTLEVVETSRPANLSRVGVASDRDYRVLDVDGDGHPEVVITSFVETEARPQCNAERVVVESLYEYGPAGFLRVTGARATRFYAECLERVLETRRCVAGQDGTSPYVLEALDRKAAALRAAH